MLNCLIRLSLTAAFLLSSPHIVLASFHGEMTPHRMPGMPFEREVTGEHFDMVATLPKVLPVAGKDLKVTFQVKSKTAPHTRLMLAFFVDGQKISSLEGVVPPYQSASTEFTWRTTPGRHRLAAKLSSALGVVIADWKGEIVISVSE